MNLEIAELNSQVGLKEQLSKSVISASVSSELNIRTQEGDLVSLSFSNEQSLQESRTQTQSQELDLYQELSTVATLQTSSFII